MVVSVAAMFNLLKGLWFDGELYKFHLWFHMIYILIMQLRGASFILRMKSRVLLRSEVGMIMVFICLHGVISWSQASGRGRFGPTKTVIAEKFHPSVLQFCLTWTVYNISNKMTKFYDDVYSFEPVRGRQFIKLYISMFEKWLESPQWLLAVSKPKVRMRVTSAWGQEYAYALNHSNIQHIQAWCVIAAPLSLICLHHSYYNSVNTVCVGLLRILRFVVVRLSKSLTTLRLGSSKIN